MRITGNTILVTGGGSGIGRALAEAFHARGNQVVVAGRRAGPLDETTAANPGMRSALLDIDSAGAIADFAARMREEHPSLDAVVHNAGIMREERLRDGELADAEAMVTTNLLGPLRLTAALLPRLLAQPRAAILTVSSGLAFVPLALNPAYCATKAAIHSWTQSLRFQLRDTAVQVIELVPPYVQTELQGAAQAADPAAMPLDAFIAETMALLEAHPDAPEICVERVLALRRAEASGGYDPLFTRFNESMAAARASR